MSRYIDADAWWNAVQKHYTDADCADDDRYELGINVGITKSRNVMMNAPSIDIVRCGECRRVREDGGHANCGGYLYCRKWKTLVDEDTYCSWGEREGE